MSHPASLLIAALMRPYRRREPSPTCAVCRDGETPDGGYCACPLGQQLLAGAVGEDYDPEEVTTFGARQ